MTIDSKALLALAERCEAATGADREIDALIWCTLRGVKYKYHGVAYGSQETQVHYVEPPKRKRFVSQGRPHSPHALQWTGSLDAAMALAPEGWFKLESDSLKGWRALGLTGPWCNADTPALALCAAALRARAAMESAA